MYRAGRIVLFIVPDVGKPDRSIECRRSFRGIWGTCLTPVPRRDRHLSSRHPQNSGRLRGVLRLAFSDAVLQDGLRAKNTKAGNKLHRGVARLAR